MGFHFQLMYTPGGQIPHADALSSVGFDVDKFKKNRVCFAINNICFAQSDSVIKVEIKTNFGTNRLFPDLKKNQKRRLETRFRSRKGI